MRNDLQAAVAHLEAMAQNAIGAAADADMPEQQKTALWAEYKALDTALTALREKAERERGCAYCVIGKRSPDAEYCSNCGRKLTPTLPELANESEEVNPDSHQYVDNYSTNRRKSVKQMGRNLYSETAETCTLFAKTATTANKGNHIRKNRRMCELRRARNEQAGSGKNPISGKK